MTNIISKYMRKSPLQMVTIIFEHLPFKPIKIGIFYKVKSTGTLKNLPSHFNVTIREGCETDILSMVDCINKPARYLERFHRGDKTLLALDGTSVAGFIWFSDKNSYEEQTKIQFPLPENSLYIYDIYVNPQQRGRGIPGQLYVVLCEWMALNTKDSMVAFIAYDNDISLRLHRKLGFVPLSKVYYLSIFGLMLQSERPVATTYCEHS